LVARLRDDVPARNGVPSAGQYEQAVKDAVADYGQRRPLRKLATLSIVSGTATYSLPADFLYVISLESFASPGGVIHSAEGLIPVSAAYSEEYYVVGTQITFEPTPQYTTTRNLRYAAGYVLDEGNECADMTDDVARVALLRAQWQALMLQANKAAQEGWQYAVGDERVNKEKLPAALREQAQGLLDRYDAALTGQVGPVGSRARYNRLGL
jgi:hypothetical protein